MLKHVVFLVLALFNIEVHEAVMQVVAVAEKVSCETLKCDKTPGQVCFQEADKIPKCVKRDPLQKYCIDKPCNMAMNCTDYENGYFCLSVDYDKPGSCYNLLCQEKKEVCVQPKGESARCVKLSKAPKCHGPNEFFTDCEAGFESTCENPVPVSDKYVCNTGCICRKGFARINGTCQTFDECPEIEMEGNNTCDSTEYLTDSPPLCLVNCQGEKRCEPAKKGVSVCTCRPGYKRNSLGNCVHNTQCFTDKCGPNEVWDKCKGCEKKCGPSRLKNCHSRYCYPGCRCSDGFRRNQNGTCAFLVFAVLNVKETFAVQAVSVGKTAPPVTCETLKCDAKKNEVCFQEAEKKPKCVQRESNRKYCVDKPCNMAMTCNDLENGYICYSVMYNSPGSCYNLWWCDKKTEVCVQKKGDFAECVKINKAPKCKGANEVYTDCEAGCEATCENLAPECDKYVCNTGCNCRQGFARINGTCQTFDKCPKSELEVKKCAATEFFTYFPPWCTINCRGQQQCESYSDYGPNCACRPNYKRNSFGKCVHNTQCFKDKCPPNEVWDKCKNCETNCKATGLKSCRSKYCYPGCRCFDAFRRNSNGTCVLPDKC
ncbi:unnamed protein product [Caenorhabditis auriculariae]|uniref:EGF-like domain-containing protein n=1 Tax=Caenorhabditis auriculariae TaxID=2777116 RepID=A0A8S1GU42_9PELO|nr:unnamed protein product [Caenorhabditis auriculariae]